MIRYLPFEEERYHVDVGPYVTYGINAKDERGNVVRSISDVSTNRAIVASLCRKCTRNRLDPIHLRDVIEDAI